MKFFLSILIISISFFKTSLAQNNVLNIDLIKIQNTDNWEFDLTYEFNNSNSNGILIELPANFKATPTSITVGDQDMWLKNSNEKTDNAIVIHWENTNDGLILKFANNVIQPATQLTVKCVAQTSLNITEDTIVSLKPINENDQISSEALASDSLNIIR